MKNFQKQKFRTSKYTEQKMWATTSLCVYTFQPNTTVQSQRPCFDVLPYTEVLILQKLHTHTPSIAHTYRYKDTKAQTHRLNSASFEPNTILIFQNCGPISIWQRTNWISKGIERPVSLAQSRARFPLHISYTFLSCTSIFMTL